MSTPIPALLPASVQPTTAAYLTPAQFRAYPTWMDTENLLPGGVSSVQDDLLADALLAASAEADSMCEGMRLSAHYVQGENVVTASSGIAGRITIQPRDVPCVSVVSLAYGWDPSALITLGLGPGVLWNQGGKLISFRPGGSTGLAFTGPAIQFGGPAAPSGRVFVTWSYVAGFVSTFLSASCAASASSIQVDDPTGIMPGADLRIYDTGEAGSGATEALTVASTYVPQVPTVPPAPTSIPLAGTTTFAHAAGTGITGMPRDILQAVIALTVAILMREDVADEEPVSEFGPAARTTDGGRRGQASGLRNDAERILDRYRPVWR